MNEFKSYHPIVNFVYFAFVIGFSMFIMNPICLGISFICGFTYSVMLGGHKMFMTNLIYMLPIVIVAAIINAAFNHEGLTILAYLPDGNPLTLESLLYGLAASIMIINVIFWFSCYNGVMTSDKFIYIFGRVIPSLSLILSMTLRLVPRLTAHFKTVINAQKCIGRDITQGSIIRRIKNGLSVISAVTTWALENSIDTSESMKARGYGIPGRSAFSVFKFNSRDKNMLIYILACAVYILIGNYFEKIDFRYFPTIKHTGFTFENISIFAVYFALYIVPLIIEIREVIKWKAIESKI